MTESQSIRILKEPPTGAKVFKAFSKYQAFCDDNLNQEHTVPADTWIDAGLEWDAVDAETVQATWQYVNISVSVDDENIENPKQYTVGPYETRTQCPNRSIHKGMAMALAIYVPPLSVGDYKVVWTITFARDVSDGWHTYTKGKGIGISSVLHVVA
jgi:hypothetical protein